MVGVGGQPRASTSLSLLLLVIIFSILFMGFVGIEVDGDTLNEQIHGNEVESSSQNGKRFAGASGQLTPHEPIYIGSDEDFIEQGWPGDGTPGWPYRIENLRIKVSSWDEMAIEIDNTRVYFVIQNCVLEGSGPSSGTYGIELFNVSSGHIYNCLLSRHRYGVRITDSQYSMVSHSHVEGNFRGIAVDWGAKYNVVRDNLCFGNEQGIKLTFFAKFNTVLRNTVVNGYYGILVTAESCNNSVTWNTLVNNSFNAVDVYHCNFWDFNGYSDYNGTDLNFDGIGDTSFVLHTLPDRMANASKDYRPRMLPMNEHFVVSLETVTVLRLVAVVVPVVVLVALLGLCTVRRGYVHRLRGYFRNRGADT